MDAHHFHFHQQQQRMGMAVNHISPIAEACMQTAADEWSITGFNDPSYATERLMGDLQQHSSPAPEADVSTDMDIDIFALDP
jgi:hypothetical protein